MSSCSPRLWLEPDCLDFNWPLEMESHQMLMAAVRCHDAADPLGYYSELGVRPDASQDDVKRAFRRRQAEEHPDKHPDDDVAAHEHFVRVGHAGYVLTDASRRAAYDGPVRFSLDPVKGSWWQCEVDEADTDSALLEVFVQTIDCPDLAPDRYDESIEISIFGERLTLTIRAETRSEDDADTTAQKGDGASRVGATGPLGKSLTPIFSDGPSIAAATTPLASRPSSARPLLMTAFVGALVAIFLPWLPGLPAYRVSVYFLTRSGSDSGVEIGTIVISLAGLAAFTGLLRGLTDVRRLLALGLMGVVGCFVWRVGQVGYTSSSIRFLRPGIYLTTASSLVLLLTPRPPPLVRHRRRSAAVSFAWLRPGLRRFRASEFVLGCSVTFLVNLVGGFMAERATRVTPNNNVLESASIAVMIGGIMLGALIVTLRIGERDNGPPRSYAGITVAAAAMTILLSIPMWLAVALPAIYIGLALGTI